MGPYLVRQPMGYLLGSGPNNTTAASNALLATGEAVFWIADSLRVGKKVYLPGSVVIEAGEETHSKVTALAKEYGLAFDALQSAPDVAMHQLEQPRGWTLQIVGCQYGRRLDALVIGNVPFPG